MKLLASQIAIASSCGARMAQGSQQQQQKIHLQGASGSGPYETAKNWIAAFEAKYPEISLTLTSTGSGAAQAALWGDVDCVKKPVATLCDTTIVDNEVNVERTVWGIGDASIDPSAYIDHADLQLHQLPAMGGSVVPVYAKDVTENLGLDTDRGLNMTFDVVAGIFNSSITMWDDSNIAALNPELKLPNEKITVLVREDESGMTETFTTAISSNVPGWPEDAVGKLPSWPLPNLSQASESSTFCDSDGIHHFMADGQTGVGLWLIRNPYSFGYLEGGYFGKIDQFVSQVHISTATHPSDFVVANATTLRTSMNVFFDAMDDDFGISLVEEDTPKGGYPIEGVAYWYIKRNHTEYKDCYQAWLLCKFIEWTYIDPLAKEIAMRHGWVTLPQALVDKALLKLKEVMCIIDKDGSRGSDASTVISALSYTPEPYRGDLHQIDSWIRPVGWTFGAIIILTSVFFLAFVLLKRNTFVVRASQPAFLVMICVGCLVMGSAIFPLGIDDSISSIKGCNIACMATPWLFACGFTITFAALFSKIWRIHQLQKATSQFRKIKVEVKDVLIPFVVLLILNIIFLLAWTLTDPLKWMRVHVDSLNSYGRCKANGIPSKVFLSLIVIINTCAVVLANVQAYMARHISDEFSESKYIAIAMASMLQMVIIGVPFSFLVSDKPEARFFVNAGMIFVITMSLLLLIFVPKIIYVRRRRSTDRPTSFLRSVTAISDGRSEKEDARAVSDSSINSPHKQERDFQDDGKPLAKDEKQVHFVDVKLNGKS
mmetsp:Transcript_26544/g.48152  ORF Transcript_26544/g.48152 Transcript_26544/m.48152 type:complete len:771 (-) Transcript_26544:182-2494(-)